MSFQSTRPVRGATLLPTPARRARWRFNPRAPCGARLFLSASTCILYSFQSTRPMRGATIVVIVAVLQVGFQSTRPMRGATLKPLRCLSVFRVSIHAPRVGRDLWTARPRRWTSSFNPRAPCGARQLAHIAIDGRDKFQSTRPVRGVTVPFSVTSVSVSFQSTRPVRGATNLKTL